MYMREEYRSELRGQNIGREAVLSNGYVATLTNQAKEFIVLQSQAWKGTTRIATVQPLDLISGKINDIPLNPRELHKFKVGDLAVLIGQTGPNHTVQYDWEFMSNTAKHTRSIINMIEHNRR
uniref:Uncharacterized protein n=1 Tax=Hirsutella minnesotensis TaxID=332947 RepID=A0A0U2ET79_9HYPO|nr:hypothetical protein [Hirsutella minnesotensis]AKR17986.1 hypothetical protein [Hirsutella minnesotensis]